MKSKPVTGKFWGCGAQRLQHLGPYFVGTVFMVALFVATIYAVIMLYSDAYGLDIPQEPEVEYVEYWLPNPSGVELYFMIEGLQYGFLHPSQGYPTPTKEHKPGARWQDERTIYLVTGDSEMPVLYVVEPVAIMVKMPGQVFWEPVVQKTYNGCGC